MRAISVIFGVFLLASPAVAQEATDDAAQGHKGQFGLSGRLSKGMRAIVTYENNVYCGKSDPEGEFGYASVCTGGTPLALDLEGSYGVSPTIDLLLEFRVGLTTDFPSTPTGDDEPRPLHLSPGARFFFNETGTIKAFVQPQVVIDFTSYQGGTDFGLRGLEGIWIELHRSYGVYVFAAETLQFSRWLYGAFELGAGFQYRYP